MQMHSLQSQGLTLADIPMGFFPDDALDAPVTPRAATAPAPFADAAPAKAAGPAPSRAVKLARAKTGESELRLLAEQDGDAIRYVLVKSTIAPYAVKREVLVDAEKKIPLNYLQATEEFDRRVALAYPVEKLRNGKTVETHLNLL
ncbi:hypothetical protein [Massilia aerilata]|uniref:Uncharacterized protein n=1 Tax=Massilia aerilata TaxID=453817 RepID=A0ABW0RZT8_9BURK